MKSYGVNSADFVKTTRTLRQLHWHLYSNVPTANAALAYWTRMHRTLGWLYFSFIRIYVYLSPLLAFSIRDSFVVKTCPDITFTIGYHNRVIFISNPKHIIGNLNQYIRTMYAFASTSFWRSDRIVCLVCETIVGQKAVLLAHQLLNDVDSLDLVRVIILVYLLHWVPRFPPFYYNCGHSVFHMLREKHHWAKLTWTRQKVIIHMH